MRAVPLQARALDALNGIADGNGSPLLFPGERGGYLDIHHFRPFQWRPAQKAAGIEPLRRIYDLRHTFATFALRAGTTFDLSRYMGASLTMIDRHYGHLAPTDANTQSSSSTRSTLPNSARGRWWTLRGRRESRPASSLKTKAMTKQGES
jgi:integrase